MKEEKEFVILAGDQLKESKKVVYQIMQLLDKNVYIAYAQLSLLVTSFQEVTGLKVLKSFSKTKEEWERMVYEINGQYGDKITISRYKTNVRIDVQTDGTGFSVMVDKNDLLDYLYGVKLKRWKMKINNITELIRWN